MTKRVVFAGGVQVKALAKAYRLDVALDYDEDVFFIGADSIAREAAQKVVSAADILVTDLAAEGPTVRDELVQVGTLRIAVPVVTADFLWPYAAGAHPRNTSLPGLPDGPYPAGFGDSFLDALAAEGAGEAEAIERYFAANVAKDAKLDDKYTDAMAALKQLDEQTGFDLADYISKNFRSQWLFATRDRPNLPLFKHIAARLFGQMGIAASRINQLSDTFFPPGAMPIHPAVLKHFRMDVPAADFRYPVLDEGYFSFEQYCRRYWNFDFNQLLHSAIAKADSNPSEAIPQLRLALEKSPDSRAGLQALKDAERAVSDVSMLTPLVLAAPVAAVSSQLPALPAPLVPHDAEPSSAGPDFTSMVPDDDSWDDGTEAAVPRQLEAPGDKEPSAEPGTAGSAPSSLTSTGIIPRSAFGSSLVRLPPALPEDTIDTEEEEFSAPSLRFSPLPARINDIESESAGALVPLTEFPEIERLNPLVQLPPENEPEPQPQPYVELPRFGDPPALPAPSNAVAARGRSFTPLPPADHLIPLLPRMLPNSRGMAGAVDKAFVDMPETMPPPPLRPVLPPELHPETVKTSLMAKIIDQLRK